MAMLHSSAAHEHDLDPFQHLKPLHLPASQDCDGIGGRLKLIEDSVGAIGAKVDKILGANPFLLSARHGALEAEFQDVAARIERVELLLLRTPLPDFKVLDDAIAALTPQSQAASQCSDTRISDNKPSPHDRASRKGAVNISISPEYIDKFYIEEVDAKMAKATDEVANPLRCCQNPEMGLQNAKWYTCPFCYALCCSQSCYHSHSKKCAKHFCHKTDEQEEEEEHQNPSQQIAPLCPLSPQDAGELQDLENSDDGEDADDFGVSYLGDGQLEELAARVESGDLDIDDLTDGEARSLTVQLQSSSLGLSWFPEMQLQSGEVQVQSGSWRPWWQHAVVGANSKYAAEETVDTSASRASALKPPLHICCKGGCMPHASVALTSLSALYAYVHTMRSFNGGWEWAPLEAAPHLLHLCPVICSHQVYSSAEECLHSSLEAAATLPHKGFGTEFDLLCLSDACGLISRGAEYCVCALQDIVEIFEACLAGGGCGCSGKLRKGMRKLEFLTSFAFHHFELLQPVVALANDYAGKHSFQIRQKQEAASLQDFAN